MWGRVQNALWRYWHSEETLMMKKKQQFCCRNVEEWIFKCSQSCEWIALVLLIAEPSSSWWRDPKKMNFEHHFKKWTLIWSQRNLIGFNNSFTHRISDLFPPHSPQWQKPICQCMKTNTEYPMWRWVIGSEAQFALTLGLRITDYCWHINADLYRFAAIPCRECTYMERFAQIDAFRYRCLFSFPRNDWVFLLCF